MRYYLKSLKPLSIENPHCVDLLQDWVQKYPGVKYTNVISDGIADFGILEGTGDGLSRCISSINGKFSVTWLSELAFIGVVIHNYNPVPVRDPVLGQTMTPPTIEEFLATYGITVTDKLAAYKEYKFSLLNEQTFKMVSTDPFEMIHSMVRAIILFNFHYNDLTSDQKAIVDADTTTLKTLYPADLCIGDIHNMVNVLNNVYSLGKQKVMEIYAATSIEELDAINLSLS
jgi:hypothetical protein